MPESGENAEIGFIRYVSVRARSPKSYRESVILGHPDDGGLFMTSPFAYDVVDYPSSALPKAHPGHLHALARMFGCDPSPADRCRVIELGCGDGTHLIACAIGLPDATFVGLDLSTQAVDRGNRLIGELGLRNVTLHTADVTTWEPPPEKFDYAIAHGLYSWVPPVVRDAVMRLYAAALAPTGIGYVSYNIYPGCYVRRMVWEILRFHTADFPEPGDKIGQAREMLKFLAAGLPTELTPMTAMYGHELNSLLNDQHPTVLYHDDLAAVNDPVYFHQFAAHADRFGLRFVAEVEPNAMEARAFPPMVATALNEVGERDVILKEQYLDFLKLRRFRQTLLATDGRKPAVAPDPMRIATLAVSGQPKVEGDSVDLAAGVPVTFRVKDAITRTEDALSKAALVALAECWPKRVPFGELAVQAAAKLGRPVPSDADRTALAEFLTAVWMMGMIDLHGHVPKYAEAVSDRPTVCPLARKQVQQGMFVTSRLHTTMRFEDAPSRRMVELLDGTRTKEQVVQELTAAFPPGQCPDPVTLNTGLDRHLERMATSGLLVG